LRLLGNREHSRAELTRKLEARGYERPDIAQVLDALAEERLLSDERMAHAYVAERLRKGFGPLAVRQELRRRGIADTLIEPHLNRSSGEWLQHMAEVAEKKFGSGRARDRKELARRARFLEYRGFPAELIARFLRGDDPN